MKSTHPFKRYWGETISLPCILPQQKKKKKKKKKTTKSKKGHNLAKILRMITNIEPDLYLIIKYPSANFQ